MQKMEQTNSIVLNFIYLLYCVLDVHEVGVCLLFGYLPDGYWLSASHVAGDTPIPVCTDNQYLFALVA